MLQLRFPLVAWGPNKVCLFDGQRNYASLGATEERLTAFARSPRPDERRDAGWHALDLDVDVIERPIQGVHYATTYPDDRTVLYYWRPTFWLRYCPDGIADE